MIDVNLLPGTAAIDTGVFLRGLLGEYPNDPRTPTCKSFCDAMIDNNRTIFVPAPSVAEICRKSGARPPRRKGVIIVPFDGAAAELLGLHMPFAKIHETALTSGASKTYLKYDSMILACAMRSKTGVIVAIDSDHVEMAKSLPALVQVKRPEDFEQPQMTLLGA